MSKIWGRIKSVAMVGARAWKEHDASQTWKPEGIEDALAPVDGLKDHLRTAMTAAALEEVKAAVYEHVKDGVWGMSADDSGQKLAVAFDVGNEHAPLIVKIGVAELMNKTLEEAFKRAAVDPDAQAVISAIRAHIRNLAKLDNQLGNMPSAAPKPALSAPGPRPSARTSGKVITRAMPNEAPMEETA